MLLDEKLGYRLDYIEHQLAHVVKDGLAVEGEGVLVQGRRVSSVMIERSNSILVWLFFGFSQSFPQDF